MIKTCKTKMHNQNNLKNSTKTRTTTFCYIISIWPTNPQYLPQVFCLMDLNCIFIKEVISVPYRPMHQYRLPPYFVPKKYQPYQPRTGEIQLFQPVNGYRVKIEKYQRKIFMNFQNLPKVATISQSWS